MIDGQEFEEAAIVRDEIKALKVRARCLMSNIHTNISEWMKMSEETPVIISSRIRLARNLENHVHPLMFPSEQEGYRVINEVQDALSNLTLNRLDTMDQQSKMKLVAKHLVSPELVYVPFRARRISSDK